jgi:DTW domain-containing protein YfiP/GNAT superfamily N-acetyltransferase
VSTPERPRGFRQPRCNACGLTPALCLCGVWPALASLRDVSIVMPASEARAASNSARLATLWLSNSGCHVRGADGLRDPTELLARPGTVILFPGGNLPAPPPQDVQHLVVPDGTWAQALRIERRWLGPAALPRLQLDSSWPSAYGLRRNTRGQLCTFEAVAIALGVLGEPALARTLLARFAEWARRARWLKSGGPVPNGPREPVPVELAEHPAAQLFGLESWALEPPRGRNGAAGSECLVRQATPEDAAAAVAVLRASITELCVPDHQHDPATLEAWLSNKTVEHFSRWLAEPENFVAVAEVASRVSGVGLLHQSGEVRLCYVQPRQQRAGIGRALLAALETRARAVGLAQLQLHSTAVARAFYESQGYVPQGAPIARRGRGLAYPYVKRLVPS